MKNANFAGYFGMLSAVTLLVSAIALGNGDRFVALYSVGVSIIMALYEINVNVKKLDKG